MPPDVASIKPGSILLYSTNDLIDDVIGVTGPAKHVELYRGNGQSLASRNGLGVNQYAFRDEGLIGVLESQVDVDKFCAWFDTVRGDGYDWQGLEGFVVDKVTQQPLHWFCSAFVAKGCDRAGSPLFNPLWNPSLITPSDFLKSVALHWRWVDVSQLYDKSI
jgi:hypothetical protein